MGWPYEGVVWESLHSGTVKQCPNHLLSTMKESEHALSLNLMNQQGKTTDR